MPWKTLAALTAVAVSLAIDAAPGDAKPKAGVSAGEEIRVEARPLAGFERMSADRVAFGKLQWRGGLVLTSPSSAFGGWSGLAIDNDGKRLLAISDTGVWLTGEMRYDGVRPVGIDKARLGPLLGTDGAPLSHNDDDSEGLAVVSGNLGKGDVLISFERRHRIVRYPVSAGEVGPPAEELALPAEASRLEWNRSLEAVCQVKGGASAGAVVTFAERFAAADGHHAGWMHGRVAEAWTTLRLVKTDGFDVTDCAGLPDGGLLVLERRYRLRDLFEGPKMRLRRISAVELAGGPAMQGEVLLEAGPEQEIDNMEGLAVHRGGKGETVISIISDDNFNHVVQRTVLLQFALPVVDRAIVR